MTASARRRRVRDILEGQACVHPGSVHDPISARIAEEVGFEIGMFAGSTASLTVLGAPDLIVLTLSEFADQARRICRAADLVGSAAQTELFYGLSCRDYGKQADADPHLSLAIKQLQSAGYNAALAEAKQLI